MQTREGHHLFFYPVEGRLVHEGLAALFAYRIAQLGPISFTLAANDYGLELLSADPAPIEEAIEAGLFSPEHLLHDIPASLNAAELARRQFREIARVAGLIFQGYPGVAKSVKQVQASSELLYDVFARYDPDNLLLFQAHREVLERQLEQSRLGPCAGSHRRRPGVGGRRGAADPARLPAAGGSRARAGHLREAGGPHPPHGGAAREGGRRAALRPGPAQRFPERRRMTDAQVRLAGEDVVLLPERALFWPRAATLVAADFHWGKGATFRAAGIPIPIGTTGDDLARLDGALHRTCARRLVDPRRPVPRARGAHRHPDAGGAPRAGGSAGPSLEILLVRGNHDRHAGDPPDDLRINSLNAPAFVPPFVLRHEPSASAAGYTLAGHLHPGAVLAGPGLLREHLPCFWLTPDARPCCRRSAASPVSGRCGRRRPTGSSWSRKTTWCPSARLASFSACE